jgi:DNA-binding NarL/FixJ family response regulator
VTQNDSYPIIENEHNMKILIADDSELIRDRIIGLIGKTGSQHLVEQAADGLETLEKAYAFDPDIIILDIHMPHKNGLQVLEEISKNENSPIILVFTNTNYPQYRKKCLNLGADRFFNKSTEFEEMFAELKQIITGKLNSLTLPEKGQNLNRKPNRSII